MRYAGIEARGLRLLNLFVRRLSEEVYLVEKVVVRLGLETLVQRIMPLVLKRSLHVT